MQTFTYFSEYLRYWRMAKGDSIRDVAKDLKVSPSAVIEWEKGRSFPKDKETVERIMKRMMLTQDAMEAFAKVHKDFHEKKKVVNHGTTD